MILAQVFSPKAIKVGLESDDKEEVFEELTQVLVDADSSLDRDKIICAINERESKMTTGIMHGIAVPHGKTDAVKDIVGCIGISRKGIDYDSLDKAPVHIVIMLLSAPDKCEIHLQILKRLSLLLGDPSFCESLLVQQTAQGVYDVLCHYEDELSLDL